MNNKREIIDIHHHIIPKIYKDALALPLRVATLSKIGNLKIVFK